MILNIIPSAAFEFAMYLKKNLMNNLMINQSIKIDKKKNIIPTLIE